MTLIVGLRCRNSIVIGSEQEEVTGYTKRSINKLRCFTDDKWAVGFSGAGDGAIVDDAERRLADWLHTQKTFTGAQLVEAVNTVLATVYKRFIKPDPGSEGIGLVIGASCQDGLCLIQSVTRTAQLKNDHVCAGVGRIVADYLVGRLYNADDKWLNAAKIAAFVLHEARETVAGCGGNSNFIVLQEPPRPRWRDLGDEFGPEMDGDFDGVLGQCLRPEIIKGRWRPELMGGYCDERAPEPREEFPYSADPKSQATLDKIVEEFEREDESA
jgi:20S proteasome alpha/beta subunit